MDSLQVSDQVADGLRNMSDKDKVELQQFVNNETQKAQIQQTVHNLTDMYVSHQLHDTRDAQAFTDHD